MHMYISIYIYTFIQYIYIYMYTLYGCIYIYTYMQALPILVEVGRTAAAASGPQLLDADCAGPGSEEGDGLGLGVEGLGV